MRHQSRRLPYWETGKPGRRLAVLTTIGGKRAARCHAVLRQSREDSFSLPCIRIADICARR